MKKEEWKATEKAIKARYSEAEKELRKNLKLKVFTRDEYKKLLKESKAREKAELKKHKALKPVNKSAILGMLVTALLGVMVTHKFTPANSKTTCELIPDKERPWAYCLTLQLESDNDKTLLYMPGTMSTEVAWTDSKALKGQVPASEYHEKLMAEWGNKAPHRIITLAMYKNQDEIDASKIDPALLPGTIWILEESRLKVMNERVIPYLLSKGVLSDKVVLMGTSMGGWNAIQYLLSGARAIDIYRAYLNSPLLTTCNPMVLMKFNVGALFASIYSGGITGAIGFIANLLGVPSEFNKLAVVTSPFLDCEAKFEHQGKNKYYHFGAGYMLKASYETQEAYDAANPFNKTDYGSLPPMLLTVGTSDEFAFFDPDRAFVSHVRGHGGRIEELLHDQGHSYIPVKEVAAWLIQ